MKRFVSVVSIVSVTMLGTPAAYGQAAKDLNGCQLAMAKESGKYIRAVIGTVGKCLNPMSTEAIENGAGTAAAATAVAESCATAFRKIVNTDAPNKQLADRFNAKVGKKCDPAINPALLHLESDIYALGAGTLSASRLNRYCQSFGGDGTINAFNEWRDCVRAAAECEARQAIATQWPLVLTYLPAINFTINALPASQVNTDASAAVLALDSAIEGNTNDTHVDITCGPNILPASGQTSTYGTGSDGDVEAGATLSFTDNGDGTITDNTTHLVWEKKNDNPASIHYQFGAYTWGMTTSPYTMNGTIVTTFLATLNGGGGFAGHTDWRIPNYKELTSILDLENINPPVSTAFHNAAGCTGCTDATVASCSCTRNVSYWTSTTWQPLESNAWTLEFNFGTGVAGLKSLAGPVRAVRGGL